MVLSYPDEHLPELQLSLRRYVDMASALLEGPDDIYDFCRMVLAGRAKIDGVEHRIFVNARQDLDPINPAFCARTRDYDSVSACTQSLPFSEPLSVFPVAPFKETLKADNHLSGKAYGKTVGTHFLSIVVQAKRCQRETGFQCP